MMASITRSHFFFSLAILLLFIATTRGHLVLRRSSASGTGSGTVCRPVLECPEERVYSIGASLKYVLFTDSWRWDDPSNSICARNDPSIRQWFIHFENSSMPEVYPSPRLTSGWYCLRTIATNTPMDSDPVSSGVCSQNGELVIQTKPNYEDVKGDMEFTFSSGDYTSNFTIRFAPTGVYSDHSMVYFNEDELFAVVSWLIYHPNPLYTDIQLYHNGQLIKGGPKRLDRSKYSEFFGSFGCNLAKSAPFDTTLYYSLYVANRPSLAGEYKLVLDNNYSTTVTLTLAPSPSVATATTMPVPFPTSASGSVSSSSALVVLSMASSAAYISSTPPPMAAQ